MKNRSDRLARGRVKQLGCLSKIAGNSTSLDQLHCSFYFYLPNLSYALYVLSVEDSTQVSQFITHKRHSFQ